MVFRKVELFHKAFARKYVENGLNGKQAYLAIRPHVTPNTATNEAATTLRKPSVKREIEALMEKAGLTVDSALTIHKRNMQQDKNLHTTDVNYLSDINWLQDKQQHSFSILFQPE